MLKSFIILSVFLNFFSLQAQDGPSINGRLIDSTTFVPVPFAHVRLKESISISNQHGRFTLNYTETDLDAEVKISCVGYKTRTLTISFLLYTLYTQNKILGSCGHEPRLGFKVK